MYQIKEYHDYLEDKFEEGQFEDVEPESEPLETEAVPELPEYPSAVPRKILPLYLREMGSTPLINEEEEVKYAKLLQEGRRAVAKIIKNLPISSKQIIFPERERWRKIEERPLDEILDLVGKVIYYADNIAANQHFERIKKEARMGLINCHVFYHWRIYSRYDYYRKLRNNINDSVKYCCADFNVARSWMFIIIKKMESEI